MATLTTVNISIPESMKADVDEIVSTEGYGNTSEFFRDLVRGYLEERRKRKLEELLLDGLASGQPSAFTPQDFDEIRKRGLARVKGRKKA